MGQSGGAGRGIRTQLNRIVLIPSITFLVLFVMLSAGTLAQAISLRSSVSEGRAGAEVTAVLSALQQERRLSAEYIADPSEDLRRGLVEAVEETATALDRMREVRPTLEGDTADPVSQVTSFLEDVAAVEEVRAANLTDAGDLRTTLDVYTEATRSGIRLYEHTVRGLDDSSAAIEATTTGDLLWIHEGFGHADALVSAVTAAGEMARRDQVRIEALRSDTAGRLETLAEGTEGEGATAATRVLDSAHWARAMEVTDTLVRHESPIETDPITGQRLPDQSVPTELGDWREAADEVDTILATAVAERSLAVVETAEDASSWMFSLAVGGGITSLFAGTVAYGFAARSAGRLTHRLATLRAQTLSIARTDLPRIVRRLEAGESVDLDTEMKQLDHGTDEVGQVADAFNIAQRTAVAAAIKQSDIRSGVNRVFLSIAHRNQSLVQRQLQLLDRVEREEEDPDLLESLFQLDHLATRGRRHAENLIILGGSQPGRRWRHPVPLMDIMRGAISETDEYARVELTSVPDLSLVGAVVADVIHLLAELVENATAYSPPHTDVTIGTENVPKGVVIEIEDRGLGMTEDVLNWANRTLADAPEFDMMTSGTDGRLGLFVVARLAQKHDIGVQLRHSPYGGTRAVVLIPSALVAAGPTGGHARVAALAGVAASPEGSGDSDLLTGHAGTRPVRPMLRSIPGRPEAFEDEAATGEDGPASAPVLRQVPDPEPANEGREGRPAPLPRRNPGRTTGSGGGTGLLVDRGDPGGAGGDSATDPDRVGAGPGRAGLPRRRKQASLAPPLRDGVPTEPWFAAPATTATVTQRSPEQARHVMAAFSAGTRRGRAEEPDGDGFGHNSDDQVGAAADEHTGESD